MHTNSLGHGILSKTIRNFFTGYSFYELKNGYITYIVAILAHLYFFFSLLVVIRITTVAPVFSTYNMLFKMLAF